MMLVIGRWLRVFLFSFALVARLEAASLKVSPGRFLIHNVKPGRLYDVYRETGLRLTIYNDDSATRTWILSVHRPSERGKWEKGYAEIPNAKWCWFDRGEVTMGPRSKAYANLFLKIPDEEKYLNQHWVVTLGVEGKPGRAGISLAVDIRAQIETVSVGKLEARPYGLLGLKPSMVELADMVPGTGRKGQVALYNNDVTTHTYMMTSLFEDKGIEHKAYLTQSYDPIPDFRWISRENSIQIGPNGAANLSLGLQIPDAAAYFGQKWEEILLILPDQGLPGFVRVQIRTRDKAKPE
jgi:hypothetical protein